MTSRESILRPVRSVVVKLGSQLLSTKDKTLNQPLLSQIAAQVVELRKRNIHVTLVSSGAIAAGLGELSLKARPSDLPKLQAVAAVGQRKLMDAWAVAFAVANIPVAQVLLTREDIDNRTRFLNLRNTLAATHELGAIPIINENDTISTDELVKISFGDNDLLAALVATALRADLLVLLSVVDGVLDEHGQSLRLVEEIESAEKLVRTEKSALGKGGMGSKLAAARAVVGCGEAMIVADGRMENILPRLLDGEEVGTLFAPAQRRRSGKDRWIGAARPTGSIVVDAGAAAALTQKNKSLLPAGIIKTVGEFARGDIVAIVDEQSNRLGIGLTNYASTDVADIRGKNTRDVRSLLGDRAYDEVVHRDNLVIERNTK